MLLPGLLALGAGSCGSWKRVGEPESTATPVERLPQLFDPSLTYRAMGLLTDPGPLGFIANVRVLAGPRPDTMLVIVALSLRNHGFAFRRQGDQFVAEYHADITIRTGAGAIAAQVAKDERVQVASFRETQRSDESVIFQQFLPVLPGEYALQINVRDRNSANTGHVETPLTVNPVRASSMSLPIAVYRARPRHTLDSAPDLVMNPRQMVQYGTDSMFFYVENYNLPVGTHLTVAAVDGAGRRPWTDTLRADSAAVMGGRLITIPPQPLTIGRYDLHLEQGANVMASTPFLVAFSEVYAVANLEDIVSLLRYFAPIDSLQALLHAPAPDRGAAWQRFWKSTDPNPATAENEAIDDYLRRVQAANERFRDEGMPGWLTERGEVFITLGEPSEVLDRRPDLSGTRGGRFIVWTYVDYRLTLNFLDDTGFGHYRLDPRSRSEFRRVATRVRGW